MESVITIPSTRVYFDELPKVYVDSIKQTAKIYSRAKEKLYNIKYDKAFLKNPTENETAFIKDFLKTNFSCTPQEYYITSLMSHAGGMISSQKELVKMYESDFKIQQDTRIDKISKLQKKLKTLTKAKDTVIKFYAKNGKSVKNKKFKPMKGHAAFYKKKFLNKASGDDSKALYNYELWLDGSIKQHKSRIALITEKMENAEKCHSDIPNRITFGSRAFYKTKDTVENIDMTEWHRKRDFSRNHMILFSGRYNAKNKNWLVKYTPTTKVMQITMMDNTIIQFEVDFPYRGDELREILSHEKEKGYSVGYWMDIRTDHNGREYFIIKASFTVRNDRLNDYAVDGVVSADLNWDNISWTELNKDGCVIDAGIIRFDLEGKSSGHISDILGRASHELIRIAWNKKKPIVKEALDLNNKRQSLAYGSKKGNRHTSMFAYSKLDTYIKSKALRYGIMVYEVDPSYTSMIGKVKYMRHAKCPIHMCAAYTIGRRGMGFKDKLPKYIRETLTKKQKLLNKKKQYKSVYKKVSTVNVKEFYKDIKDFKKILAAA